MAKPWKHPDTGIYYVRRQVPKAIRPAFAGRQLFKETLGTKDPKQASVLFLQANAELELRFQSARNRLAATGSACPSPRDKAVELVEGYFNGAEREPGGLAGPDRLLLTRLEIDRGLWNLTPGGCTHILPSEPDAWWQLANNVAKFRTHPGTKHRIRGHAVGSIWQLDDRAFRVEDAKAQQVARIIEQVARHNDLDLADLPSETASVVTDFLNVLPVGQTQMRKPRPASGRLRPTIRLLELFADWKDKQQPRPQSAAEYESAALDFIDLIGDIPVAEIERNDMLDFRDEVGKLPAALSRADRAVTFTDRIALHIAPGDRKAVRRLSPASVKKRVGAIQALLTFAFKEEWIKTNVGREVPITGYSKRASVERATFADEQIRDLLGSALFTEPANWSWKHKTSDCTLYWLFLLCLTTGSRIEEIGQVLVNDVRVRDDVLHIDIDDYVAPAPNGDHADGSDDVGDRSDAEKSLKTASSRRVVPIHARVEALGFVAYCDAIRAAGHTQLFPDLVVNEFSKHTQDASKRANRLIDRIITKDPRLVFHSLRHTFKDLAREVRIAEHTIDQICGHSPTTVGGKYGRGVRLQVLARELQRLKWKFVDWEALERAAATVDWASTAPLHNRQA